MKALKQSKEKVENTISNIQKELTTINGTRLFQAFKPLAITDFQGEHDNCTSYLDQLINSIDEMKTSIEDYNGSNGWEKAWSSIRMAVTKIFEGLGSFGEQLVDGAATIVGFATCWALPDEWDQTLSKFIEKDWVGDTFEDWYSNGWLSDLDKASNFTHTSGTASVFKVTGEIIPYIAITVATHGAGAPALEAAMATLSTTGRTNQANLKQQHSDQLASGVDEKDIKYDFYAASTPAIGAGIRDGLITYGIGKATQAMAARHTLKSGGLVDDVVDKADDAARAVSQNSDDFVDAAEKLAKAENELNAANKAGASIDELGRLEEARDAAKHAFTELGGNADDVIGKSKEISKAESILKEAEKKWKFFEEGEAYSPYSAVAEEADKARDAYQKALKDYRTT